MRSSWFLFVASSALVGCLAAEEDALRDTCTYGDNMTAPRLAAGPEPFGSETRIVIGWDRGTGAGADLPRAYFERVGIADSEVATRAGLLGEREIFVVLRSAPAVHAGKTETCTLVFPDRNEFSDCRHRGMSDVYELAVAVTFSADGESATATFEQNVARGPL